MGRVVVIARRVRREVEPDVEPVEEIGGDDVGPDPSRVVVVARKKKKPPRTAGDLDDDELAVWRAHLRQLELIDELNRYYAAGGVPPSVLATLWDEDQWNNYPQTQWAEPQSTGFGKWP